MFNGGKAPFGFVHRGRLFTTNFIGAPGRQNHPAQTFAAQLTLVFIEVWAIQLTEQIGHLVILANQRTAGHLGGVGRQHQLDRKLLKRSRNLLFGNVIIGQALQHLLQPLISTRIPRIALVLTMQPLPVMLLGNIAQVKKLTERTRDLQQSRVIQRR